MMKNRFILNWTAQRAIHKEDDGVENNYCLIMKQSFFKFCVMANNSSSKTALASITLFGISIGLIVGHRMSFLKL